MNMKNNNYTPSLPEEEIIKLVKESSDNNLTPSPYSYDGEREITNKVEKIVNELVEIIKKEKQQAFQAGLEEGSKRK
jgi:hypothetical protein